MKTLVTGATGLLGNNVVRQLVERDREVRVLIRESSDTRPLADLPVEICYGDIRDAQRVQDAVDGAANVVHCACHIQIGWSRFEFSRAVNVTGTAHVARACRASSARLIHVSSVDALGIGSPDRPADETSPRVGKTPCTYVVTKCEGEEVVLAEVDRGLDAVIVNPSFMLGPWDWKPSSGRMLLGVAERFTPLAPSGGCTVSDARDVATGILSAIEHGRTGERYILGGRCLTYLDLWREFAAVTGTRPPWRRAGRWVQKLAGAAGDATTWLTGREPDVNSASVAMSQLFHYYCSDRAERELSYSCRPLEQSIRDAWDWLVEQRAGDKSRGSTRESWIAPGSDARNV